MFQNMHVCTNFEPERTGFTVYNDPFHTGLLIEYSDLYTSARNTVMEY